MKDQPECVAALRERRCAHCHATAAAVGQRKLRVCGRCESSYYCCVEHQHAHWHAAHKGECKALRAAKAERRAERERRA